MISKHFLVTETFQSCLKRGEFSGPSLLLSKVHYSLVFELALLLVGHYTSLICSLPAVCEGRRKNPLKVSKDFYYLLRTFKWCARSETGDLLV